MSDSEKTLIDRDAFVQACEVTGTCELHEDYQFGPEMDQICVAFTCSGWREAMQFFVNLAAADTTLASNMVDVVRFDTFGFDCVYYFPGYDFEDEDGEDEDDGPPGPDVDPEALAERRSRGLTSL